MPSVFDPIQLGAIDAKNRILMAPLTRGRATAAHVPTELMIEYYRQRASAGLIITEATGISREGLGWPYAPGIWSEEQVEAWKPVTAAVHEAGGRIAVQLWHMGRAVHSSVTGQQPVSSSATAAPGKAHTYGDRQDYEQARPLELNEIPRLLEEYAVAARNAITAGFDGVQVHAANGYLIDEFLRDNSNFRDDAYGGSIDNRVRLLREVAETVAGAIGGDRTGFRLSPNGESQGVDDSDPHALFPAAAKVLADAGVSWLELREPGRDGTFGKASVAPVAPAMKAAFGGPLVLNSDYDFAKAQAALDAGEADAIAFGRRFLANPDLPARFAKDAPLNPDDMPTWYSRGPNGYIDYPALEDEAAAA
jgi:N-ethylmaleimide reductase